MENRFFWMSSTLLLLWGCSSAPSSQLSYKTTHQALQSQVYGLTQDLNRLRDQVVSDYQSGQTDLKAVDLRKIQGSFDTIVSKIEDQAGVSPRVLRDRLSFFSISDCPLGNGRCPLAVIARTLSGSRDRYQKSIDRIDETMLRLISGDQSAPDIGVEVYLSDPSESSNQGLLPRSGYEPAYEPTRWNDRARWGRIQESTNCYAYMLNVQQHPLTKQYFPLRQGEFALQPGNFVGKTILESYYDDPNVKEILKNAKEDAQAINGIFEPIDRTAKAPPGSYKVALVIAPDAPYKDYHWYRQNPDGTWSHKPGLQEVRLEDASGHTILDPQTANRRNEFNNYRLFIGYFVVKARSL